MYALRLLKKPRLMDRKQDSKIMVIVINTSLDVGTVLPIVIENYIVSEAKVLKSNVFSSALKVVLQSDNELVPEFDVINMDDILIEIPKNRMSFGNTQNSIEELPRLISKSGFVDVRPCTISQLRVLIPDLFDYSVLSNLQLNVRFK